MSFLYIKIVDIQSGSLYKNFIETEERYLVMNIVAVTDKLKSASRRAKDDPVRQKMIEHIIQWISYPSARFNDDLSKAEISILGIYLDA